MSDVATAEPAEGAAFEAQHVHEVYERIASHFSSTRYKPWPIVSSFLASQPAGNVGVDAGCGNGKYLPLNPGLFVLASDRSGKLLGVARQHRRHEALVADLLALPHPTGRFDFALSIAAVHHLSTRARRVEALTELLRVLRPSNGRACIFVWALEQKNSRRGWQEGDEQDVMVPWVMTSATARSASAAKESGGRKGVDSVTGEDGGNDKGKVFQRYYHLYRRGELDEDIANAGGLVVESGYDRDNWWAIAGVKG